MTAEELNRIVIIESAAATQLTSSARWREPSQIRTSAPPAISGTTPGRGYFEIANAFTRTSPAVETCAPTRSPLIEPAKLQGRSGESPAPSFHRSNWNPDDTQVASVA